MTCCYSPSPQDKQEPQSPFKKSSRKRVEMIGGTYNTCLLENFRIKRRLSLETLSEESKPIYSLGLLVLSIVFFKYFFWWSPNSLAPAVLALRRTSLNYKIDYQQNTNNMRLSAFSTYHEKSVDRSKKQAISIRRPICEKLVVT